MVVIFDMRRVLARVGSRDLSLASPSWNQLSQHLSEARNLPLLSMSVLWCVLLIDSCYPSNIYCYLTRFRWSHDAQGGILYTYMMLIHRSHVYEGCFHWLMQWTVATKVERKSIHCMKFENSLKSCKKHCGKEKSILPFLEFFSVQPSLALSVLIHCKMCSNAQCSMQLVFPSGAHYTRNCT